ncbi:MAG: hypothetical protein GX997_09555 [Bacteroidales bacterium]|nr:hypothetical protein [Bacteroidales bacterium]
MAESRLYINRQFNRQILKDIGAKLNDGYNIFVILSYEDKEDKEVKPSPDSNNFIMDDLDYVYNNSEIKYIVKTDKTENLLVAAEENLTDDIVTFKGRTYYTSTFADMGNKKFNHLYVAPEVVASYENQPEPDGPIYYNTTTILLSNITASQTHYDYTLNNPPTDIDLEEAGKDTIILAQARHTNKVLPKQSGFTLADDEKTLYMMLKI